MRSDKGYHGPLSGSLNILGAHSRVRILCRLTLWWTAARRYRSLKPNWYSKINV